MRSSTMHRSQYLGRLGRDPEIKETQDGKFVAKLSVSEAVGIKDVETGGFDDKVIWHRITAFGQNAEFAKDYLHKGDSVFIEARNRPNKWTDEKGEDHYSLDVIASQVARTSQADSNGKAKELEIIEADPNDPLAAIQ